MDNAREYAIIMKTNVTEGDKRYQYQYQFMSKHRSVVRKSTLILIIKKNLNKNYI